jgi:hypothetical protein
MIDPDKEFSNERQTGIFNHALSVTGNGSGADVDLRS